MRKLLTMAYMESDNPSFSQDSFPLQDQSVPYVYLFIGLPLSFITEIALVTVPHVL